MTGGSSSSEGSNTNRLSFVLFLNQILNGGSSAPNRQKLELVGVKHKSFIVRFVFQSSLDRSS